MTRAELEQQYTTVAYAARLKGVTTQTVYRWLTTGRVDGLCFAGGAWMIDRASLDRVQAEPTRPAA